MAERNGKVTRAEREAREFPDNLRPTERRVYDFLSDGERHTKWEIARVIDPELPSPPGVRVHICNLRAHLANFTHVGGRIFTDWIMTTGNKSTYG